jgi:hypothetical protein
MTNLDRIKAMSVEEFAKILVFYDGGYGNYSGHNIGFFGDNEQAAIKAQIEWLESEVEK